MNLSEISVLLLTVGSVAYQNETSTIGGEKYYIYLQERIGVHRHLVLHLLQILIQKIQKMKVIIKVI